MDNIESSNAEKSREDVTSRLVTFAWAIVGLKCVPYFFRDDNNKYVPVRIVESEVRSQFVNKLKTEAFNCADIKSFTITEAEKDLLNLINNKHCDQVFGEKSFSVSSDYIVKLDDVIEFYNFMDTCYNMLLSQNPISRPSNRFGFVRVNDDNNSIVPYIMKNNRKYLPLFYFDGETKSLEVEAITLEKWDVAYLKFCCKAHGIKKELFAGDKCHGISLEEIKLYFHEDTKFDDYWPFNALQTQQREYLEVKRPRGRGRPRRDANSAIVSGPVPRPSTSGQKRNRTKTNMPKQLHNNRETNFSTAKTNLLSNVPVYPNSTWSNASFSGSCPLTQPTNQSYIAQKMNSVPAMKWP